MIEVAALTDLFSTPSSRFRIRGMISPLKNWGISVTDLPRMYSTELSSQKFPNTRISRDPRKMVLATGFHLCDVAQSLKRVLKAQKYSATWISREIVIGHPSWECYVKKPYYYDIDDAIFLRSKVLKRGIDRLISGADCVFAGNDFLADYCSKFSSNIVVVPTAVDTSRFCPNPNWLPNEYFKILWSGTSSSFPYLKAIERPLLEFLRDKPNVRIQICSDRYPHILSALQSYIDYQRWSPEAEVSQIQDADIGLMPIPENDWARGKCAYKMLLYNACGVPCVVSNVGMNCDILAKGRLGIGCITLKDWRTALETMYHHRFELRQIYPDGPTIVKQHYSADVAVSLIGKAMGGSSP
jgi:glycosyltransferase involved in cell wall biosynthesis